MSVVFRPRLSRYLPPTAAALGVVALGLVVATDGIRGATTAAPWVALLVGLVWAAYGRPHLMIDDSGILVVNVFRSVKIPWPAVQRIDTKWALTLYTAYGKITAWAAPAPGAVATRLATPRDLRGLPESTYGPGESIRPGDLPQYPSGAAAGMVRRRWETLRDAGHLDNPRLEFQRPPVTWHWATIGVGIALVVLGVAPILMG